VLLAYISKYSQDITRTEESLTPAMKLVCKCLGYVLVSEQLVIDTSEDNIGNRLLDFLINSEHSLRKYVNYWLVHYLVSNDEQSVYRNERVHFRESYGCS